MNLHHHSLLPRCFLLALLILLLAVGLMSCAPAAPVAVNPPLSTLRVVMDNNYPPYVFLDDQGKPQGILIDQWKLWEIRTGVKVEISALPWGEALQRMKAGEFDVIDTIFYTDERARSFDFTAPYAQIDVPIFFQNNISGIADANDLKGFRVAVKSGDANADYLVNQGITGLVYYNSYEEIVKAAARKEETIFVIDQPPALYYLYKYGIQDQFKHSTPLYSGEFHRAVQKGNTTVLNLVTDGFSRISPAEYQAIDQRWLGTREAYNLQQFAPYVLGGAAIVLVIILILIVFNRTLQVRVRQRTQELEETAEALHESRSFLADLIEYGGALIFVKDRAGRYELINRKWEEVTGLKRDQVIGQTDEVLFPGPIGQQFRANDVEVIETGTVLEREEFLEDAKGKRSFISIKFPVRGEDGHIKGICGMTTEITERKQAEEALRASEERLRTVTENAPDTILQVSRQGIIQFVSRPVPGLTRERVIGSSIYEWTPQDQHPILTRALEAVFATGQRQEYESLGPGPNGEVRSYHVRVMPVMIDHRADSAIYIATDISERTRAEEALRQSEDKFSKAFHTSPDSININRLSDGLYLEINEGFTSITGYTAEDVRGKTSVELNIWANPTERARLVQGLQEHGQVSNLEAQFRMKDGRLITGLMSARIIEIGGETCILNITRDISARKQTEEALRESEEKFRAMIEQASEGFALIDEQGRIMEWNRAMERIWGFTRDEVLGRPFYDVQFQAAVPERRTPERYQALKSLALEALQTGQSPIFKRVVEGELCRPDGQRVMVQQSVFLIKSSTGYRFGSMSLDITERKRAEAEIKQLNQDLERRVADRTRELAAANARLTELDHLKSKFVSDVSHELRTPIANLKLYIDLLERGKPEKQSHYITVLQQQVLRVMALVDDILDLSRLERRKEQGTIYQPVALNELVAQAVLTHQPRAEADGLLLTFEPVPDLPPVRGNADQLAQVVTNLIANALNYTLAGYVRISTGLQGNGVCLSVKDSGSGIDPDDLPHIFERFYRGQRVLKNDVPGTGLGLAIVKEIVELHEGRIEVESQPERGSTFEVWLPLAQAN